MQGTVGDMLGASGSTLTLTWNGVKYPVAYPTLKVTDRVEKLVARRALDEIAALKEILSQGEFAEMKAELNSQIRAGQHGSGGAMWVAEFTADGGSRGLCFILWASLAEARESLPPAERAKIPEIAFDDIPKVIEESEDAAMVLAMISPDFVKAVGIRKRINTAKMEAGLREMVANLKSKQSQPQPGTMPA